MSPYLAVADLVDGRFAVVAIDPAKRVGSGCSAIVQSIHASKEDATRSMTPYLSTPDQERSNGYR